MKLLKALFYCLDGVLLLAIFLYSGLAMAQAVVTPQDFMTEVLTFVQGWGGIPTALKVAGIITLILSSMKVSALHVVWDRLGSMQAWAAPVLGLMAGVMGLGAGGAPLSAARVLAYVGAGSGAIILHELLDTVKEMKGVGPMWVACINLIEGFTGGQSSS